MEGEVAVDRIYRQQTYRAAHPMRLEKKKGNEERARAMMREKCMKKGTNMREKRKA